MRMKNWMKYLSMLMSWVLLMTMAPSATAFAAEDGAGKIVLTSFEKLEKPEKDHFEQGTELKDLGLPEKIKAYGAEGTEYELTDLEWTIRPVRAEDGKEDTNVEPVKYDPEFTAAGEYIFTLKLSDAYEYVAPENGETDPENGLPKVDLTIDPKEAETETETQTEAPTEAVTESVTEAQTEAWTDAPAETEALTEAPTEPVTEAQTEAWTDVPTETEAWTEAPTETEPQTEAWTDTPAETEAQTEAWTEAPTESESSAEAPAETEPVSETDDLNSLIDAPMIKLVLPEKMEVGKAYQLQYEISNEELAAAGEASVSYGVEDGSDLVDMPDKSGNFTVEGEGTVAFQVDVMLANGTELQTYAQGETVPADPTDAPSIQPADDNNQQPTVQPTTEPTSDATEPTTDAPTEPATEAPSTEPVTEPTTEAPKSDAAELVSFTVGDITAAPENGEIHITLPCNSTLELTNITPVIAVSDKATVSPASETVLDFSDGAAKTFNVTAEDGVTVKTYQVTVTKAAHSFGEWTVSKEATCTEAGEEIRTCSVCGATETQAIPAKGHTASEKWVTTKKATCTEKGTQVQKCTVCGVVVNTRQTKALGHNWETITKEPTCTEAGEEYKKCTRCGEIKDQKTLEALGHDWIKDENTDADGWKTTVSPTTTSKGKQERTCSRCGTTETREIQRLNIVGSASNNYIWGFTNPAKYPVNSVITFEAIGDGTDNEDPISGDVRYVPTSTWNLVNDYKWGSNGYTASFRITKAGNYTLKVTFMKQMYDGSQWVDTGETSVSTQDFTIAGEGQFTDENGNGTGNTNNPDEVIGGGVKTGDNTPIVALVVVLVIAAALLVILGVVRKKSKR